MTVNMPAVSGIHELVRAGSGARDKVHEGAGQFEGLLIAQMLKSARETGSGGLSGEQDQTSSTMMEMAEECFAGVLSSGRGLGLGAMIEQQLKRTSGSTPAEAPLDKPTELPGQVKA